MLIAIDDRLRVGLVCILVVFTTIGCAGGPGVSNDEAKDRALAAEEAYITEQLENASCVQSWSLRSFVGIEEEATTLNETATGIYVEVSHPYSYATNTTEADVGTEARYFVTANMTDRLAGTTVSPC